MLYNFGFSGARMAVSALGSFLISVIIARSLGTQNMGSYSFFVWVAGTIASLSSLGLPDAISKYVAEHRGLGEDTLAAQVARHILSAQIIVSVFATLIGAIVWSLLEHHQIGSIVLAISTVLPSALQQTLFAMMEGEQRFDLQVLAALAGTVIQIAVVSIFALLLPSIQGFLFANLISSVFLLGIAYFTSRFMMESASSNEEAAYPHLKRLLNFSLSVYALWLLNLIVFDKSEMLFLRILKSPQQLAYYSIAFALTARLGTAADSISYVLFPMFVTRLAQKGNAALNLSYSRSIGYVQVVMVPLCLWGISLFPRLIVFAYGKQYSGIVAVIQILLAAMMFSVTLNVSSCVALALERQRSILHYMIFVAALNVILDLLLIPRYGALGAALANGVSQATAAISITFSLQRVLPASFPIQMSLKIYLAALLSVVPILYADLIVKANILFLLLSGVLASMTYIALLGRLRVMSKQETDALKASIAALKFRKAG